MLMVQEESVKGQVCYMKHRCNAVFRKIIIFFQQKYGDTKAGVSCFIMIAGSLFLGITISENMENIHGTACVAITSVLCFAGFCLLRLILKFMLWAVTKYGVWTLFCILLLIYFSYTTVVEGLTPANLSWQPALVFVLVECVFARCLYALIKNKKRNFFVFIPLILTLAANIYIGVFCAGAGYDSSYIEEYRELNKALQNGNNKVVYEKTKAVGTFTYGMKEEEAVKTRTISLKPYMDSYSGITKKLRDWYWGYGEDEIPLEGKVWYPEETGRYPVLCIIHGNADMAKESYLGYDYLGEYLAGSGYIVVSVNEAWCNYFMGTGFSDENDARAVLLLENIQEILSWDFCADNPLYQKIQRDAISIAGHSRGGEAVAIAAEFNQLSHYPDDGTIRFHYHFPIETVIAIAPTADQYRPSGRTVTLKDVNYFLIQGGNDQDVSNMMGIKQYEHVLFSGNAKKRKAYLYIAGANHGQFNTQWGRFDIEFPGSLVANTKPLLKGEEQRHILEQYMKVCLDVTMKGKLTNQDFLWNIDCYGKSIPETVYLQAYQDDSYESIAEFEEDADLTTGSEKMAGIQTEGLDTWMEGNTSNYSDYDSENFAACLGWNGTKEANYQINFEKTDFTGKVLSLDVMDIWNQDSASGNPKELDFTIQLTDRYGNIGNVGLAHEKTVYPPLKIVFSKVVEKFNMVTYKRNFQTVRIDAAKFEESNLKLDIRSITGIKFVFNKRDSGKLLLDHVGISSLEEP